MSKYTINELQRITGFYGEDPQIEDVPETQQEQPSSEEEIQEQVEKAKETQEVVDLEQSFVVEEETTTFTTSIDSQNELQDMDIYVEFPKCAAEYID